MNPHFICDYWVDETIMRFMMRMTKGNFVEYKHIPANNFKKQVCNTNWEKAILFNHESAQNWFNKQVKLMLQIAIMQKTCQNDN